MAQKIKDMNIEISQVSGIIVISERINNVLYKRTYIDYKLSECKKDFIEYIKTIKN